MPDLRPIAALKARIYLKQGRPDKARAWAAERGLSLVDEVSYLHEFEHLTLARLEIANPLVNALLARLLQAAEAQKRRGSALDILLVQALAHEAQGNRPQALPRWNAPWPLPSRKAMFASLWMKAKRPAIVD